MTLDERLRRMRAERTPAAERAFWRAVDVELHRWFRRRFDRTAANELVARATAIAWRKLDGYEPTGPDSFERWLHVIATVEARSYRRELGRAAARRARLRLWAWASLPSGPLTVLLRVVRRKVVRETVEELPPQQREALEFDDARALAEARKIDLQAARMRRRRALRRLLERLRALSSDNGPRVRDATPT